MVGPLVIVPLVPATRKQPSSASSSEPNVLEFSRIWEPCFARLKASSPISHGFTMQRSSKSKFAINLAIAPTFPSNFGPTRMMRTSGMNSGYSQKILNDSH